MDNVTKFPTNSQKEGDIVAGTSFYLLDEYWFSPGGNQSTIGVVLVEDSIMHVVKSYIGTGTDAAEIAKWGAKVPRDMAESIFGPQPNWHIR